MTTTSATRECRRILLITRNLPPLRGGMERLNQHMALELAKEFEVAVVGPAGCRSIFSVDIAVGEVAAKPLWRFFFGALWQGLLAARRSRPDIVLAGSGLTAPFAWCAASACGARMAVYVHGLDLIAAHPVYRWLWRPFIRRADLCIANSRNTARLAVAIGVPESRIRVVHPGVDMPPQASEGGGRDFRTRFGLDDRPLLLSVGRLITRKGLLEFVENALCPIVDRFPEVCLVALGDEVPDLLQGSSAGLGERIRMRAAEMGIASNLRFIGPQDDATLADAFEASDVHVFPGRDIVGDVEGFGMVAVEAASHALPTVAFAVGGVPDAIEDGVSGRLVAPGDYGQFAQAVIDQLNAVSSEEVRDRVRNFAQRFAWEHFGERVCGLLRGANQAKFPANQV